MARVDLGAKGPGLDPGLSGSFDRNLLGGFEHGQSLGAEPSERTARRADFENARQHGPRFLQ